MTDIIALAQLSATGEATITWRDPRQPQPASMTIVELGQTLRDEAPYRPSGVVTALVRDMTEQARHQAGAFALMAANHDGDFHIRSADVDDWIAASAPQASVITPASTPLQPQQPASRSTQTPPGELTWLPAPPPGEPPVFPPGPAPQPQQPTQSPAPAGFPQLDEPASPRHGGALSTLLGSFKRTSPKRILGLPSEITTAVFNTKGGAGKTTLAILIAAAAAHLAGHNDIALIDCNPSGNTRRRTYSATNASIVDLADAINHRQVGASQRDLDPWISWQPGGWFAIPAPIGTRHQDGSTIRPLTETDVDRLVDTLHRTCRLLIADTGNDAGTAVWQRCLAHAMPALIPIQWDPDTLSRAQEMLTDLELSGQTNLRDRVILVGTHSPWTRPDKRRKKTTSTALMTAGWAIHEIPADRHISEGRIIEWDELNPRTQRAAISLVKRIIQAATTGTTVHQQQQ